MTHEQLSEFDGKYNRVVEGVKARSRESDLGFSIKEFRFMPGPDFMSYSDESVIDAIVDSLMKIGTEPPTYTLDEYSVSHNPPKSGVYKTDLA